MNRAETLAEAGLTQRPTLIETGFALACFVGSAATVQKYGGTASTVAYLVVLLGAVPLLLRASVSLAPELRTSTVLPALAGTVVLLAVLFFVIYPHANTHATGVGSDRDDAADLGAHALLRGQWPYHGQTYLGHPISQLPGLLLLAVPFVALGHSAYAALFWLPVLFLLLWHLGGERETPLFLTWLALVASPAVVREVVTGGDLLSNTVSVMVAMWLVDRALAGRHRWRLVLAGLFLGFVLSSRLTFVFVLPPLLVLAWRRYGVRPAIDVLWPSAVGFAAVTLPFYVGHSSFPPFSASDHLSSIDGSVPGGQTLVIAAGVVLSAALALLLRPSLASAFAQAATVQAFFLVVVAVHDSVQARTLDLYKLTPGYGMPVVLLALGALVGVEPYRRTAGATVAAR